MVLKVSPYPIPEFWEFLRPYREFFYRRESVRTLERVATGLIADGGSGDNSAFLDELDEPKLASVVGIHRDFGVRLPDEVAHAAAQPQPPTKKPGRPRTHPHPVQVAPRPDAAAVLAQQPEAAWQTIS